MTSLAQKTLFITGASRGIGKAIALRAAKDGANIVIAAKTDVPHPKLEGTIHTAKDDMERAGGRALALVVDVRDERQIAEAVNKAVEHFGGIDIVVNNASAIFLKGTLATPVKRFDLMHEVNVRATFLTSQAAIPHLRRARNPHILNLAPPLSLHPRWFKDHLAYTMSKYGMGMCVLGMAEEFRADGIKVNALWPRSTIATAAVENVFGKDLVACSRRPEIVADAAHVILTQEDPAYTGKFLIDEDVLTSVGVTDFSAYAIDPTRELYTDLFLDTSSA